MNKLITFVFIVLSLRANAVMSIDSSLANQNEPSEFEELLEEARLHPGGGSAGGPVWPVFMESMASCAPGCRPYNFNVFRAGRRTCHATGRAIDVGGLNCNGHIHLAINGGRFSQFVRCMDNYMTVLYHNGRHVTAGHHDHAHFSIGCSVAGHPNYY